MTGKRKSRGRQKFLPLAPVSKSDVPGGVDRDVWIDSVCDGFVTPGDANRAYYRVFLEELWPPNHGIPGPRLTEDQLREAVDRYRQSKQSGNLPYRPYKDVFRRMRELQGEEGVIGIGKEGRTYQLVNLTLGEKRVPRIKLSDSDWHKILENYSYKCAVCSRSEPEVRFQQDHKIPRVRGGGNELENWQPLCDECNNFKSTACRGCNLDCRKCSWAFPERFAPLRLSSENITKLRQYAVVTDTNPHDLLNQIVDDFFKNKNKSVDRT